MAISRRGFVWAVTALKLSGLVALLIIVGLTFWLALQSRHFAEEVAEVRTARSVLVEARGLLQDMETGQRGYLLTRQEEYLAPYETARAQFFNQIDRLEDLRITAQAEIDALRKAATGKAAELSDTIELARKGQIDEAMAIVRSDRGKRAMDEARSVFARLLTKIDDRIEDRVRAQDRATTLLLWSVTFGALLIVLVTGGSTLVSLRYTREVLEARQKIETLNADLERRVEQRTEDLARANEEIQRFAYVVSHDLRSPLVNVIGFTKELEELGREIFDPEGGPAVAQRDLRGEFEEALGFIDSSVSRMDKLITAILKIARENGRRLRAEPIDLHAVARAAADSVQHRVSELGGSVGIDGSLPPVVSDRMAVEQIVSNLVDNAAKYTHPDRPPRITITGRDMGDQVALVIADNGRGIAPGDHEKVFGMFNRVGKATVQGEGIGLAHVRALARRLGGDVTVESSLDAGARFSLLLPKTMPQAA